MSHTLLLIFLLFIFSCVLDLKEKFQETRGTSFLSYSTLSRHNGYPTGSSSPGAQQKKRYCGAKLCSDFMLSSKLRLQMVSHFIKIAVSQRMGQKGL